MNNDQLQLFCLIIETGTITEAAKLMRLTPGAVSRSMNKLSDEVGFKLFHQSGRNVMPTEQSNQFYQLASQSLAHLKSGIARISQAGKVVQPLRIASFEVFTTYVMNDLIQTEFFDDEFLVLEKIPGKIELAVLSGEADYGITYAPVIQPGLTYLKVTAFRMGAFKVEGKFNSMSFARIPFAVPTTPLGVNLVNIDGLDGWPRTAPQRLIKYRFELLETAVQACQSGMCATFIPEFIAAIANSQATGTKKLEGLPLPPKMPSVKMDVFLVIRKNFAEGKRAKAIAKVLRRVCALTI